MGILTELAKAFSPSHDAFIFMWLLAAFGTAAFFIVVERWLNLQRRTDYDAFGLFEKVKILLENKKTDEAFGICAAGGQRALPRILAAGIHMSQVEPNLIAGAMAEESTHMAAALEKRLNLLVMFGNVFTLFGLLGTVYGLIMSFDAVSRPEVAAIEKSSLLAAGISTAMNSTLVGLSLSVLTVMLYAFVRARVDAALQEIDRYSVATLNILVPPDVNQRKLTALNRGGGDDGEIADADVTPMLNLMVILIPVLLTSSEFVKVGTIELKLPEATQSGGGGGGSNVAQDTKLELGVVITTKGFNVFSYFKAEDKGRVTGEKQPDIPLVNGQYDFTALGEKLADIKKKALFEVIRSLYANVPSQATLGQLYKTYIAKDFSDSKIFSDHESVKIVAEDKIKYESVVSVMDAARGYKTPEGNITMFPNVAIAGGIIQ
jgi:biopolymer transport protein ExbB/TolQ/biopolymer transport protein ExbD